MALKRLGWVDDPVGSLRLFGKNEHALGCEMTQESFTASKAAEDIARIHVFDQTRGAVAEGNG